MADTVGLTASGRLPNLVIVGVAKAGTSSLFNYLGQHPAVCGSDLKELRYFTPIRYQQPLEPLSSYAAHFALCTTSRYAMEATPGYFYGGRALARTMKQSCPDVRALISLRAPTDRCWSWYRFVKSRTRIPQEMSFGDYLDRCEALHDAGVDGDAEHQPYWGLGAGCYSSWLDDWVQEFDDRFRVVFFDDLVGDVRGTITGICDWLDIDAEIVDSFSFPVDNKTEQFKHGSLQRAAVALNRRSQHFSHRHRTMKKALRGAYYAVNGTARRSDDETMGPDLRKRLDDFYQPYNDRLTQQLVPLGLTLPSGWTSSE